MPLEATADRLQGSVRGSGGAREAKRPQPQGGNRSRSAIAMGTGGLLQPKPGGTSKGCAAGAVINEKGEWEGARSQGREAPGA